MAQVKAVVEQYEDCFVAYPLGVQGAVVGQGNTAEEALADLTSALEFHVETFGSVVLEVDFPIIEATVQDVGITVSA